VHGEQIRSLAPFYKCGCLASGGVACHNPWGAGNRTAAGPIRGWP